MTQEAETILMIKGAISELPREDQLKVETVLMNINSLIKEYGSFAILAIALKGAELQMES